MTRSLLLSPALAITTVAFASTARAAGAEGGETSWTLLALHALNLGILLYILVRFAGNPIRKALAERSESIRREIEGAEAHLRQVEAQVAEVRERLANIDDETARIIRETVEAAEAERARSVERATRSGERIREEARRVADTEVERARQALRDEAAALATTLAREILREQLTPDDDRRLTQEMIDRIAPHGGRS